MQNVNLPNIVDWCATECYRQRSGELSVSRMFSAWMLARLFTKTHPEPTVDMILSLAERIDPDANRNGFRKVPVRFMNGNVGARWNSIPEAMERLVKHGSLQEEPLLYYEAFQKIHPFEDGNGRLGAILFNWCTLDSPILPPTWEELHGNAS